MTVTRRRQRAASIYDPTMNSRAPVKGLPWALQPQDRVAAVFLAAMGIFGLAIGIATMALLSVGAGVFEALAGSALLVLVIRAYRANDRRLGPTTWQGLFWDSAASMALLIALTTGFVVAFIRYHSWVSLALAVVFAACLLRFVKKPLIYLRNWRASAPDPQPTQPQ